MDANFVFQDYLWHEVVEMLDNEDKAFAEWEAHQVINPLLEKPNRPIHQELYSAMQIVGEEEHDQAIWEIRMYAKRNQKVHSGVLELGGSAKYDELFTVLARDLAEAPALLPKNELQDLEYHRNCIRRHRAKFFELADLGDGSGSTWEKKAKTKAHENQVTKEKEKKQAAKDAKLQRKEPDTPEEKLRKTIKRIEEWQQQATEDIGATRMLVQALADVTASSKNLNPIQKRVLSRSSIQDQAEVEEMEKLKRQRMSERMNEQDPFVPMSGVLPDIGDLMEE
ncbi:hypothetical protein MMC28_006256 [Mycoblastus sanguinarius]|nr:hypothetical protein [Mycoblastus sanguinarius]